MHHLWITSCTVAILRVAILRTLPPSLTTKALDAGKDAPDSIEPLGGVTSRGDPFSCDDKMHDPLDSPLARIHDRFITHEGKPTDHIRDLGPRHFTADRIPPSTPFDMSTSRHGTTTRLKHEGPTHATKPARRCLDGSRDCT